MDLTLTILTIGIVYLLTKNRFKPVKPVILVEVKGSQQYFINEDEADRFMGIYGGVYTKEVCGKSIVVKEINPDLLE